MNFSPQDGFVSVDRKVTDTIFSSHPCSMRKLYSWVVWRPSCLEIYLEYVKCIMFPLSINIISCAFLFTEYFNFSLLFYVQYCYQSDVLNLILNNINDNNVLSLLRLGYAVNSQWHEPMQLQSRSYYRPVSH